MICVHVLELGTDCHKLVYKNLNGIYFVQSKESHKDFQQMSVTALQLGVRFLFNTFFRCKKKTK